MWRMTLFSALQLRNSVMLASKGNLWICSLFFGTSEFNELIPEFSPRYKNLLFYSVTPCYQWYMRLQSYYKMSITKQQKFSRIISPLIDTLYCGNTHHLNWHLQLKAQLKLIWSILDKNIRIHVDTFEKNNPSRLD